MSASGRDSPHAQERDDPRPEHARSSMARLTYITNMSLDGFVEDRDGAFDFGPVDDEQFATYTELLRTVGTFLYGRRLYEAMAVWETDPALAARSPLTADFADAWKAARKVVYSTTLAAAPTADTRIERAFDAVAVRQLKAEARGDLTVGGAHLAAQALHAGLVDECLLFVWPVTVGGGKPALPADARLDLELLDERRFANGVLLLRYRPR
jgi:dihydrofolate reductase